jgi:2-keto-myo-inositol isomerase
MIETARFSLNRIACPKLSLDGFFGLAKELGLRQVELRNDLADPRVTDGLPPEKARELAAKHGVEVITINALQKFNLSAVRSRVLGDLDGLVSAAKGLGCKAIVLCPNNDTQDQRPAEQKYAETVEALAALRPYFEKSGLFGLVEPLGFTECSLRSARTAMRAIDESGGTHYRLVHDTFHHHLGTDGPDILGDKAYAARIGLIHASGVEAEVPKATYRDPHRILVTAKDKLKSREQIHQLTASGYKGPVSFEPFAAEVQALDRAAVVQALRQSLSYLQ